MILCVEDVQTWEKEKLEVDEDFNKDENLPKLFTQRLVLSLLLFALVKHSFLRKLSISQAIEGVFFISPPFPQETYILELCSYLIDRTMHFCRVVRQQKIRSFLRYLSHIHYCWSCQPTCTRC